MHLSLNLAPIFCLKGHIPTYLHTLLKFHSKSRNLTLFKEGYLPTWKSFYFLQLPTIQVALIFIACFTQNPTLTTSTLWWNSFLNCILIFLLIFTIYFSNLFIVIWIFYEISRGIVNVWNRKSTSEKNSTHCDYLHESTSKFVGPIRCKMWVSFLKYHVVSLIYKWRDKSYFWYFNVCDCPTPNRT